jgi:hypothetical protein
MRLRSLTLSLVVAALPLAGCAEKNLTFVPDGYYSGSTSTDQEVDLQVNGGEVKLDGKTLKRDEKGRYVEKKRKWVIDCTKQKGSKDITCELTRGGRTETVELMRL